MNEINETNNEQSISPATQKFFMLFMSEKKIRGKTISSTAIIFCIFRISFLSFHFCSYFFFLFAKCKNAISFLWKQNADKKKRKMNKMNEKNKNQWNQVIEFAIGTGNRMRRKDVNGKVQCIFHFWMLQTTYNVLFSYLFHRTRGHDAQILFLCDELRRFFSYFFSHKNRFEFGK